MPTEDDNYPASTQPALAEPPLHMGPEFAVAEDVHEVISGEPVAGSSLWRDARRRLLKNKLAGFGMVITILIVLASLVGPGIIWRATGYTYDFIPKDTTLNKSFAPFRGPGGGISWTHPMGTDNAGRDVMARVLSGGQISLMVALISTLVSLVIGVSYGATAGYLGGRIDDLMMRIVDGLYSLPYVIIVIVLLALLPAKTPTGQLAELFFALGAVSWLAMARIVRGQVMSLKNQDFVLAARAIGVSTPRIIFRHLVPNALGPVIVYATLTIPTVMLSEAFLSIMRLILEPPGKIVSGEIRFAGRDVLKLSAREVRDLRGKRVAMIFQDPMTSLNPFLRISKQLMEVTQLHLGHTKEEAREHAI